MGRVENLPRQPGEVLDLQAQRANRIERMRIEAGADQHQLRLDLVRCFVQGGAESGLILAAPDNRDALWDSESGR